MDTKTDKSDTTSENAQTGQGLGATPCSAKEVETLVRAVWGAAYAYGMQAGQTAATAFERGGGYNPRTPQEAWDEEVLSMAAYCDEFNVSKPKFWNEL
jgi:hypothetical protein